MYTTHDMKKDNERAMFEYRERAFYKKYFVLGRLRQKGDEKPVSISCFLGAVGVVMLSGSFA